VPICHCDPLRRLTGTLDIRLIKDEDNIAAHHRGPRNEVPQLCENLVDRVELAQDADPSV